MNVDELINKLKDLESGYKHLLEKNNKKIELWSRISELSKELIFNLEELDEENDIEESENPIMVTLNKKQDIKTKQLTDEIVNKRDTDIACILESDNNLYSVNYIM